MTPTDIMDPSDAQTAIIAPQPEDSAPSAGRHEATASIGQIVAGRYALESLIARGKYGSVWRAVDTPDGEVVALKLLRAKRRGDSVARKRFEREAHLLTRLTHPNVVRCTDFGVARGDQWYLALELLRGETLARQLERKGAMQSRHVHALGLQLLQALSEAHALSVIHRDVKPANIMMCKDASGADRAKLIDWGIAKVLWPEPKIDLTQEGAVLGSLRYLPPEQIRGEAVTPASDVYAVGCVLFECLSGEPPFAYATGRDLAQAHLFATPQPPERAGEALRGPLVDLLLRLMAKDPSERPSTPRALEELAAMRAPYVYRVT